MPGQGGGRFAHGLFKHVMDVAALLIQHQKRKPELTAENVMSSASSDLSLRGCMWDASYLMGCIPRCSSICLGTVVLVPAVLKRDRTSAGDLGVVTALAGFPLLPMKGSP